AECLIRNVEAARIGAEGRQDETRAIADEAAAAHTSPPSPDGGGGMEMARDLTRRRAGRRFMAEDQAAQVERLRRVAAEAIGPGIVIARDPEPAAPLHQGTKTVPVIPVQPGASAHVMKGVAQRHNGLRA